MIPDLSAWLSAELTVYQCDGGREVVDAGLVTASLLNYNSS